MVAKFLNALKWEWERTLLGGMLITFGVGICFSVIAIMSLPDSWTASTVPPSVKLRRLVTDVSAGPYHPLPTQHAMRVQLPYTPTATITPELGSGNTHSGDPTGEGGTEVDAEMKTPVPVKRLLTYHGYITSPNGTSLAWINNQVIQGGRHDAEYSFVRVGDGVTGYRVSTIGESAVELVDAHGRQLILERRTSVPVAP